MHQPEWSPIEEVFLAAAVLSGYARIVFLDRARDDTFAYIAGKFLQRHRVSVAAAALVGEG